MVQEYFTLVAAEVGLQVVATQFRLGQAVQAAVVMVKIIVLVLLLKTVLLILAAALGEVTRLRRLVALA
jgi:hypothetical protein